jgi:hypothetical protein
MSTIGKQFKDIITPRVAQALEKGSVRMANDISDQMMENTERGRGFGSDPYVNVYHPRSVENRSRMGLQTGTVNLRRGNNRIEDTKVVYTKGDGAKITFLQGGDIFKEHHLGKPLARPFNRGVPMRSIWPKSKESVPKDIIEDTQTYIHEVLSGGK